MSQTELENAESSLLSARTNLENLRISIEQSKTSLDQERVQLQYTDITAPLAGTIIEITQKEGATLNASQTAPTVMQIADLRTLTVQTEISEADIARLGFHGDEFVMKGDAVTYVDVPLPAATRQAPQSTDQGANQRGTFLDLQFEVELRGADAGDAVIRATVSNKEKVSEGRTTPVLLGDPVSPGVKQWTAGLLSFASSLPINSHGEPTPSDRDPIPPPFNNTYN